MTGPVRLPQRLRDVLITAIVTVFLVGGSGYLYTNYVQRQADRRHDQIVRDSERKWCEILNILTGGPAPTPGPAGDRARVVGALLVKLRQDFGC